MITGISGSWIKLGHFILLLRLVILSMCKLTLMTFSIEGLRIPNRVCWGCCSLPDVPVVPRTKEISTGGGALTAGVNQLASPLLRLAIGTETEM